VAEIFVRIEPADANRPKSHDSRVVTLEADRPAFEPVLPGVVWRLYVIYDHLAVDRDDYAASFHEDVVVECTPYAEPLTLLARLAR
jgi:hypothetical protein